MISEKYRVLLVEDNLGDARLVQEFLREDAFESFELDHVISMQEALLHLQDNEPQVVLLDLGLPDSSGINTLEMLYQHNPRLPIIVLTGMDQDTLELESVREGAQDYLAKSSIDGRLLIRAMHFAIQRKANEERMRELLRHDLLTELPNRRALIEELSTRMHTSAADNSIGILFINLDQFKLLNENYGNRVGDSLLKAVGERLSSCFNESDFVARIERDEFVVLTQVHTRMKASLLTSIAEKTLQVLSKTVNLSVNNQNVAINVTGSIGVASYALDERSGDVHADRLIGNAEMAMKKAKSEGGNHCHYFDEQLNAEAQSRIKIAFGLQNALKNQEFDLNYQPILDIGQEGVFGYEVLLRWNPSFGGRVGPDQFIPVLEESFQIISVGEWVMEKACSDHSSRVERGLVDAETRLFINFSPRQFVDPNLLRHTLFLREKYQIPAGVLHYEITENLMLTSADFVLEQLNSLQEMGVRIAIDDFGSGFSSMNYLKDMPCDFLKIDKSFVQSVVENERNKVITSAIIHLGESLDVGVIAEGVETEAVQNSLLASNCSYQQGYFQARPMDGKAFDEWLTNRKSTTTVK